MIIVEWTEKSTGEPCKNFVQCLWNSPFSLEFNCYGRTVPDRPKWWHGYSWCETITWRTARQIAVSSEINTWKYLIAWFTGKGIRYDPSTYCRCCAVFVSKAGRVNGRNAAAFKTKHSRLSNVHSTTVPVFSVHSTTVSVFSVHSTLMVMNACINHVVIWCIRLIKIKVIESC